jgi:RNA polymerase sigma-70 factor (ECF subfamily)
MTDDLAWDAQWAEEFERHRPHLRAIAYRMLGSLTEADDAVQDTWLRLSRSEGQPIQNLGGWLTTAVGRVCIDILRARTARRETLTGTWLPEPVVSFDDHHDPEQQTLLADSVGLALLVVLESLQPAERLAFVLHDMFGVPYDQIAPIIGKSPAATRQIASRARRRVQGAPTAPDADLATQRRVVDAFLAAARRGDFDALITLLDPDVTFHADTGERRVPARPLLTGAREVAAETVAQGPNFAASCYPALVNGAIGVIVRPASTIIGVAAITVIDERITEIDLIIDPRKLAALNIRGITALDPIRDY